MPRYLATIRTPVTAADAFADLSRFDRAAAWDPGVARGSMLTPPPVGSGPGSRWVPGSWAGPWSSSTRSWSSSLTAASSFQAETSSVRSRDRITFDADVTGDPAAPSAGEGTVVTYDARLEPRGAAWLALPLLSLAFRRIGDRAAAGLRARLHAVPA